MSDYICPYCGQGITEDDWWEMQPEEDYETGCPNCEREFKVSYYVDTVFTVTMPEELDACTDCDAWDGIYDCCAWSDRARIEEWNFRKRRLGQEYVRPMTGCPLGHDKEETADER